MIAAGKVRSRPRRQADNTWFQYFEEAADLIGKGTTDCLWSRESTVCLWSREPIESIDPLFTTRVAPPPRVGLREVQKTTTPFA